ncbi:MAG TPA: 50S ribosomal protein L25 [Chthonomonadales bacterium]|nr:50S ribosomal protein L25 [Chthonomonadales bacterium]
MNRASLVAKLRPPMTKGQVKQLRRSGFVPATVSHRGEATQQFQIPAKEMNEILRRSGMAAVIEMQIEGTSDRLLVLPRQVQRNPIGGNLLHVAFRRISEQEPVTADVPVVLIGEPEAVRNNLGVLTQQADMVQVRAIPDRLPAHLEVDVSALELGHALTVADLPTSPDYEIVSEPDTVLASLAAVRIAVEAEAEEAEELEEAPEKTAEKSQ